ncbi:FAD-dependent oxidoreductase domain-containing protein 1 isoform X2 [Episyrphus balteatus]|uniref:FAD-dependent oxidoreductase domain-containing protein 1 isoform X2 n=1 Tax=Episyrphus balteatus TaxID=286459 RepID=UPI0024854559|nr:FAD-dependent oxidoreductase domain-containing protein 1 isoform X2 [Episyrphus balteatus]
MMRLRCTVPLPKKLLNIGACPTNKEFISTAAKLLKNDEFETDPHNPLRRSLNIITRDFKPIKDYFKTIPKSTDEVPDKNLKKRIDPTESEFQTHCDVVIIGGGCIGLSIAFWLKEKARSGLNVVVIEKDPTYRKSSAARSYNGLNFNFLVPENLQMAMYGADFLRDIKHHLGSVNLNFTPFGSIRLASEKNVEVLKSIFKIQNELGVRSELLTVEKIKSKFPWINTDDIVLGCHGLESEGWFDPLALLFAYKKKAAEYEAHFVDGELIDFEFQSQSNILVDGEEGETYKALDKAIVQMPNGEKRTIKFALCVIAGGSCSGQIARLARIGNAPGFLRQEVPAFTTPLTLDPNGCYFTREGLSGNYLCGKNTDTPTEQTNKTLQETFDAEILPSLTQRVRSFKNAQIKESWTETYAYNYFDGNGIIGAHPYYNNLYIAAGFNRHGIQQSPAVGRALSELIIDGRYRTIDLARLSFDRFIVNQPLYEVSTI